MPFIAHKLIVAFVVAITAAGLTAVLAGPTTTPATTPTTTPATALGDRPAPPDGPARAAAERLVKDIFRADYAKPGAADRRALGRKLLAKAAGVDGDPAGLYVLLREARDAAAAGHDPATAAEAVRRLHDAFAASLTDRLDDWSRMAGVSRTPEVGKVVVRELLALAAEAAADDDYDVALKAASEAKAAAQAAQDMSAAADAERQLRRVTVRQQQHAAFRTAERRLAAAPDDRPANLAAGSFLCFAKGDWQRGLPLLAKGTDARLAEQAGRDLATPTDVDGQLAVADGWWDLAERRDLDASARDAARGRSARWYQAVTDHVSGLVQEKVAARLASLADVPPKPAAPNAEKPTPLNLLTRVDPRRDFVDGTWNVGTEGLVCGPGGGNKLRFDYRPRGEYDLRVAFTRTEGAGDVVLMLPYLGHRFMWVMGAFGNAVTGFGRVAGKNVGSNAASVDGGVRLENGHKYECVVRVRRGGVAAYLDGKLLVRYATDFADLSPQPAWDVGPDVLGVGGGSRTVFHAVEVVEVGH